MGNNGGSPTCTGRVAWCEVTEKYIGQTFVMYGRFVARNPWTVILLSFTVSALLGVGLLGIEEETDKEYLYTPQGSLALEHKSTVINLFDAKSDKNFYLHQLTNMGYYGQVLVQTREPGQNVLTEGIIREMFDLDRIIKNISIPYGRETYTYEEICAVQGGKCVEWNILNIIDKNFPELFFRNPITYPIAVGGDNYADLSFILGGANLTEFVPAPGHDPITVVETAEVLRLQWHLRQDSAADRDIATLWETEFVKELSKLHCSECKVVISSAHSIIDEMNGGPLKDVLNFSITFVIMCSFAAMVSCGGNWVSTRVLLALMGVIAAFLSIIGGFGLVSLLGLPSVSIVGVAPFLILGIGVDDMFIIMSGFKATKQGSAIEDRIAETFRTSAVSITISSLANLLAFIIGATSRFPSVSTFCIYTGVAVIFCYLNQITFFGGCLVLHARRVEESVHCCACKPVASRQQMEKEQQPVCKRFWCSGSPPDTGEADDSVCERGPRWLLPSMIVNVPAKVIIIIAFSAFVGVSIFGATKIEEGMDLELMIANDSYYQDTLKLNKKFFSDKGPVIAVVFNEALPYWEPGVQSRVNGLLTKLKTNEFIDDDFEISWLNAYSSYLRSIANTTLPISREQFINVLKNNFLPVNPLFLNDVVFNSDNTEIIASRVYVQSHGLNNTVDEGKMMTQTREIVDNSDLPAFAFSFLFIYYEQYISVFSNTLITVGIAICAMFFVCLFFIPNCLSIIYVTLSMIMIIVGLFAFMHFWNLTLNFATMIQIVLSVGFCVDFCAHVCHAYMISEGETRDEKTRGALQKVGGPIFNSALSSVLGIVMLVNAQSYVFKSFCRTMLLVIILGAAHALLFLPVILSLGGPVNTIHMAPQQPVLYQPPDSMNYNGSAHGIDPKDQATVDEKINVKENKISQGAEDLPLNHCNGTIKHSSTTDENTCNGFTIQIADEIEPILYISEQLLMSSDVRTTTI